MNTIKIYHKVTGQTLFTYEADGNTVGRTVEAAVHANADLRDADLRDADLRGAELSNATLCGTNLHGTNLHGADLSNADLSNANMHGANLHGANLRGADLRGADLCCVDLRGARLCCVDLRGVNLDYSTGWSFSCRHSRFTIGISHVRQILAHLCSCKSDDPEVRRIQKMVEADAIRSHRARDLGLREAGEDE